MSNPPKWAQDLLIDACLYLEIELPELTWRRGGLLTSSGNATKARIVVTAGRSRIDQKLVLLHETAHTIPGIDHHSSEFWDAAWKLFRKFKVPIRYALNREKVYRKGAVVAYRRNRRSK